MQQTQYATRVEKILAELNNPESDYILVVSHRGDWRNYPENSIPAIESLIRMGADMMEKCVEEIHKMGSKLWVNTFWPSVCGGLGNDDDAAIDAADPADVYGQYVEMGASLIQTDRPAMVIEYLRSIGRHD